MSYADQLEEALLQEGLPDMMKKVLAQLSGKWRKLWTLARKNGIGSLRTRDKVLLMQALEKAAVAAGYNTPMMMSRAVDMTMAYTTSF